MAKSRDLTNKQSLAMKDLQIAAFANIIQSLSSKLTTSSLTLSKSDFDPLEVPGVYMNHDLMKGNCEECIMGELENKCPLKSMTKEETSAIRDRIIKSEDTDSAFIEALLAFQEADKNPGEDKISTLIDKAVAKGTTGALLLDGATGKEIDINDPDELIKLPEELQVMVRALQAATKGEVVDSKENLEKSEGVMSDLFGKLGVVKKQQG